jgi:hypothetical protein
MHDSYTLSHLLKEADFKYIISRNDITSYLDNWMSYSHYTESDGSIY